MASFVDLSIRAKMEHLPPFYDALNFFLLFTVVSALRAFWMGVRNHSCWLCKYS